MAPPKPTTGAPARAATTTFHERFTDGFLSSSRWRVGLLIHPLLDYDHGVIVRQANGALRITPRAHAANKQYYGVVSVPAFDLTSSTVAANVLEVPANGPTTVMAIGPDMDHFAAFRVEKTNLVFEYRSGGERSRTEIVFDPMRHRFWRFRELTPGMIAWETSPDGISWHVQHATEASFPLTAVTLELAAGTDHPVAEPGTAVFGAVDVVAK